MTEYYHYLKCIPPGLVEPTIPNVFYKDVNYDFNESSPNKINLREYRMSSRNDSGGFRWQDRVLNTWPVNYTTSKKISSKILGRWLTESIQTGIYYTFVQNVTGQWVYPNNNTSSEAVSFTTEYYSDSSGGYCLKDGEYIGYCAEPGCDCVTISYVLASGTSGFYCKDIYGEYFYNGGTPCADLWYYEPDLSEAVFNVDSEGGYECNEGDCYFTDCSDNIETCYSESGGEYYYDPSGIYCYDGTYYDCDCANNNPTCYSATTPTYDAVATDAYPRYSKYIRYDRIENPIYTDTSAVNIWSQYPVTFQHSPEHISGVCDINLNKNAANGSPNQRLLFSTNNIVSEIHNPNVNVNTPTSAFLVPKEINGLLDVIPKLYTPGSFTPTYPKIYANWNTYGTYKTGIAATNLYIAESKHFGCLYIQDYESQGNMSIYYNWKIDSADYQVYTKNKSYNINSERVPGYAWNSNKNILIPWESKIKEDELLLGQSESNFISPLFSSYELFLKGVGETLTSETYTLNYHHFLITIPNSSVRFSEPFVFYVDDTFIDNNFSSASTDPLYTDPKAFFKSKLKNKIIVVYPDGRYNIYSSDTPSGFIDNHSNIFRKFYQTTKNIKHFTYEPSLTTFNYDLVTVTPDPELSEDNLPDDYSFISYRLGTSLESIGNIQYETFGKTVLIGSAGGTSFYPVLEGKVRIWCKWDKTTLGDEAHIILFKYVWHPSTFSWRIVELTDWVQMSIDENLGDYATICYYDYSPSVDRKSIRERVHFFIAPKQDEFGSASKIWIEPMEESEGVPYPPIPYFVSTHNAKGLNVDISKDSNTTTNRNFLGKYHPDWTLNNNEVLVTKLGTNSISHSGTILNNLSINFVLNGLYIPSNTDKFWVDEMTRGTGISYGRFSYIQFRDSGLGPPAEVRENFPYSFNNQDIRTYYFHFHNSYIIYIIDENGLCLSEDGKWENAWGHYKKLNYTYGLAKIPVLYTSGAFNNYYYWGNNSFNINVPNHTLGKRVKVVLMCENMFFDIDKQTTFNHVVKDLEMWIEPPE